MLNEKSISRRKFLANTAALSSLPIIAGCADHAKSPLSANVNTPDPVSPAKSTTGGMPMRPLGKTGVMVSALSYGIGGNTQAYDTAIAGGINLFDFNRSYSGGDMLARYFKKGTELRSKVLLSSKIEDYMNYTGVKNWVDQILKDMEQDYVDIVMMHACDTWMNLTTMKSNAWKALQEVKVAGKVRFIGFSDMNTPSVANNIINTYEGIDVCLLALNSSQTTLYDGYGFVTTTLPLANKAGIGVTAMKTLSGLVGAASAETLWAYVLNLKDSEGNPAVASITSGMNQSQVQGNINLVKKIIGPTGVVDETAYNFKELERRTRPLCNPESLSYLRPDYRDGKPYVWS
jgi:predicted aldo/keto reductase-like oxidoreductase